MNKVIDLVNNLGFEELTKIQHDLEKGGKHLKNLVDEKIREQELNKQGVCVTCGATIEQINDHLTLLFGPTDLKQKANFCALDCLNYFLEKMKTVNEI